MKIQTNETIGRLVAYDYRLAAIFSQYNIDYFCRGNRSIAEVCESKNLSAAALMTQIKEVLRTENDEFEDFNSWRLDKLSDYIIRKHHPYIKRAAPVIKEQLAKVCKVEGDLHPELFTIYELFTIAVEELAKHMKEEEELLFPYIKKLVKDHSSNDHTDEPDLAIAPQIVGSFRQVHDLEEQNFLDIRDLSNNYRPHDTASEGIRLLYRLLKDFEDELHMHLHLENNILYPKASVIENLRYISL